MVPYELREGTVFAGDYRVLSPLARGGMGAVYVAEQLSTGKRRALKVMSPRLTDDLKARERFVQEARVGGVVDSSHIVEVIAAGIDEATQMPWLAMELLDGETLQERLDREGAIAPGVLREIAIQLRHALGLAHQHGIVHRDLKPENLFLERPRRAGVPFTVKILDFGIAKLVQQAKGRDASGTQALGSPLWMAPEQADASPITPATDVWAIGLVAFAAITGRVYWRTAAEGDLHLTRLLVEILVDPLAPASHRAEELGARVLPGAAFDGWLARCLARDPTQRFGDAGACLDSLVAVLEGGDFVDTGSHFPATAHPLAETAPAGGARRAPIPEPDAHHEPIVRREAPPTRDGGSAGMGLGQIAALLAGTVLAAGLAIFGGLAGYAVFAPGAEDDLATGSLPEVQPPRPLGGGAESHAIPPLQPLQPHDPVLPPITVTEPIPVEDTPPVKRDGRRLPVARTAAGRALYQHTIAPCWQEELTREAHGPTRMELELQLTATGTSVANLRLPARWQGSPFARCVMGRLSHTQLDARPSDTRVVLNLPGAP